MTMKPTERMATLKNDMVRPCGDCPFRSDTPCFLTPENAILSLEGIILQGQPFACHKTVEYSVQGSYEQGKVTADSQHCAGAFIFLKHLDWTNDAMEADNFDAGRLDMSAPVFSSLAEFMLQHNTASVFEASEEDK